MSDLSQIVADHSDAVWRTVYRLLNDRDDALDCFQETFLAAQRLASGSSVKAWRALLVRIATHKAIDRLRQRYRALAVIEGLAVAAADRPSATLPDANVEAAELRERVRRALLQLPDEQAEAFWLRHLEELSTTEIAEQMGIELGHVRVLVHRAAVALRSILGGEYGPVAPEEKRHER
jgi:RNA polymerase sigma factor (sigma-70 family)